MQRDIKLLSNILGRAPKNNTKPQQIGGPLDVFLGDFLQHLRHKSAVVVDFFWLPIFRIETLRIHPGHP